MIYTRMCVYCYTFVILVILIVLLLLILASLSVKGDVESMKLAQVLKECLASTDPLLQIQLISKVLAISLFKV